MLSHAPRLVLRLAFALTATGGLAACAHPAPPWRFDEKVAHFYSFTDRDDRILSRRYQNWVRLEYVAPWDHPVVVLWFSPTPFGQNVVNNEIVALPPVAWARTQLRLAAIPCPPLPASELPVTRLTIANAGRVTQRCLAKQDLTCAYADVLRAITQDEVIRGALEQRETYEAVCANGLA